MNQEELSKRDQRSENLHVYQVGDWQYLVESSQGEITYKVSLDNGRRSCTCSDFQSHIQKNPDFVCKHILAAMHSNGNGQRVAGPKKRPRLDSHWITQIKGKDFVVYSGLLDLAHQIGLDSVSVEVMEYPKKDNGFEAVVKATTRSSTGQCFVDYADANPKNTNSLVVNHLLRVASTRAKARTLRDMTNIGMTCLEELGNLEEVEETSPQEKKTQSGKQSDRKEASSTSGQEKKRSQSGKQRGPEKGTGKKSSTENRNENNSSEKTSQTASAESKAEKSPSQSKGQSASSPKEEQSKASPAKEKQEDNTSSKSDPPTAGQINAIRNLASRRGISEQGLEDLAKEKLNLSFQDLTSSHAARFIKLLQQSA